jgi:DNA-binding MarR family transcriptional regulator
MVRRFDWKYRAVMADDQALASAFRHLSALGMRVENRLMREKGVSLAQSRLLEVIQYTARARWSDIATVLGYSPRTITEALDTLERDGLVTRTPDPADRRAKILTITKKGARDLAAAQGVRDQVRGVIFGVLTDDERERLLEMLERISTAAKAIDTEEPLHLPG